LLAQLTLDSSGFATFGRVYGAIITISGVCNVAQIGLVAITHELFHDNPTPVNAVLAGSGFLVGVLLTVYVRFRGRILRKRYDLREYAPEAEAESEITETTSLLGVR
jgi:high-affinity Fe2+/Pb2+ permease